MRKSLFEWMRVLPTPLVCNIATLGRIGFWGRAPGTNGSIVGIFWYTLVFAHITDPLAYIVLFAVTFFIAVVFCDEAEIRFNKRDPGYVILDEVIAIPLCFLGMQNEVGKPHMWIWIVLGFLLFRFFDIIKPLGIKKLQHFKGGYGV